MKKKIIVMLVLAVMVITALGTAALAACENIVWTYLSDKSSYCATLMCPNENSVTPTRYIVQEYWATCNGVYYTKQVVVARGCC